MSHRCDCGEIAWAAGFFEGEGSFTLTPHRGRMRPQVTMPQSGSPALLERFWLAVGTGSVTGPYLFASQTLAKKPRWTYQAYGHKALSVMARLAPFMSGPKLEKFLEFKSTLSNPEAGAKSERRDTPSTSKYPAG